MTKRLKHPLTRSRKDDVPTWPKEMFWDRAELCRIFLAAHGFLADAENARVKARIKKHFEQIQKELLKNGTKTDS